MDVWFCRVQEPLPRGIPCALNILELLTCTLSRARPEYPCLRLTRDLHGCRQSGLCLTKTRIVHLTEFSIHGKTLPAEKRQRSIRILGVFSLEGAMFLCQPLLEVLAGLGIEAIDAFLKVPSRNDLPDPFSIPSME